MGSNEARMRAWIRAHKGDPDVRRWLRGNPPPEEWDGTEMEWAWTEMPIGIITGRPGRIL